MLGSVRRYYIVIAFSARAVWCIVFLWDATDFFPSVLPNEHLLMCTSGWKCAQAMRQMNANLHDLCRKTPPHLFGPCNFNSAKKAPDEKILECEETTWGDENYTRWISELPEIMSAGRNPGAGGCRTLVIHVSTTVLTPPVSTHLLYKWNNTKIAKLQVRCPNLSYNSSSPNFHVDILQHRPCIP